MNDFIRARSDAQKTARMDEIKTAADALAQTQPYPTITLSAIAAQLSWTRANLYKYVTSKEEIYLELCADKMNAYFDALAAAFPAGKSSRQLSSAVLPAVAYPLRRWMSRSIMTRSSPSVQ